MIDGKSWAIRRARRAVTLRSNAWWLSTNHPPHGTRNICRYSNTGVTVRPDTSRSHPGGHGSYGFARSAPRNVHQPLFGLHGILMRQTSRWATASHVALRTAGFDEHQLLRDQAQGLVRPRLADSDARKCRHAEANSLLPSVSASISSQSDSVTAD